MDSNQNKILRKRATLNLTPIEMTYIARLVGAETLFGIGDPFFGWLTGEIKEAWSAAHQDLKARGLIEEGAGGRLRLDVVAGGAVAVCSSPEERLILKVKEKGEDGRSFIYHKTQGLCVGHPLAIEASEQITLTLFEGPEEMGENIISIAGISGGGRSADIRIRSNMDALWKAMDAAEINPAGLAVAVAELCRGRKGSEELLKTLRGDYRFVLAAKLADRVEEKPLWGVAFLQGGGYLWEIVPDFSDERIAVDISLTTPEDVRKRILDIIGV